MERHSADMTRMRDVWWVSRIDVSRMAVLAPIRELALQISKNVWRMSETMGVVSAPVVGGTNLQGDIIRVSNGVHVMIGMPGRVVDLIEKKVAVLAECMMVVFDEADKLLDMTFSETVTRLLGLVPRRRQMMLYSATFPLFIAGFVKTHMYRLQCINLMDELVPVDVRQLYTHVQPSEKLLCLKTLLLRLSIRQCVIFCNGIRTVELLEGTMQDSGCNRPDCKRRRCPKHKLRDQLRLPEVCRVVSPQDGLAGLEHLASPSASWLLPISLCLWRCRRRLVPSAPSPTMYSDHSP